MSYTSGAAELTAQSGDGMPEIDKTPGVSLHEYKVL
jgi:hypothetical protein